MIALARGGQKLAAVRGYAAARPDPRETLRAIRPVSLGIKSFGILKKRERETLQ
jgi:hypothetical protein